MGRAPRWCARLRHPERPDWPGIASASAWLPGGILGGMLLAAARHDPKIRAWVIKEAAKAVTREVDKKRLEPLLDELKAMKDDKEQTAVAT